MQRGLPVLAPGQTGDRMSGNTINNNVTSEAQLDSALQTFNSETVAGTYTIDVTAGFTDTADLTAISNLASGVSRVIDDGAGLPISATQAA